MPKHKIQFIYNELYGANIFVSYGVSSNVFLSQLKKELDFDYVPNKDFTNGRCLEIEHDDNIIYWIWTNEKRIDWLAHEVFHVVNYILSARGLTLSDSSSEAYAYFTEFIFKKIML